MDDGIRIHPGIRSHRCVCLLNNLPLFLPGPSRHIEISFLRCVIHLYLPSPLTSSQCCPHKESWPKHSLLFSIESTNQRSIAQDPTRIFISPMTLDTSNVKPEKEGIPTQQFEHITTQFPSSPHAHTITSKIAVLDLMYNEALFPKHFRSVLERLTETSDKRDCA